MSFYKKSLLKNASSSFPVVIIGGGINGAGVFRDLSLHGIPSLLIDKFDFTSQTSQSSSKMLHGGIRYLENLDFSLVWEALHEKNLWLKLTPHLTYEESFYLPVYKNSLRPLWMIRAGCFLYDALSSFQNRPSSLASPERVKKHFPLINHKHLKGAAVYSDAVMDDAKLTLECIYDGLVHQGSYACNHTSLTKVEIQEKGYLLTLKDELTNESRTIHAGHIIFTTGPFTDKIMQDLGVFKWTPKLMLSRGSHLWFENDMLKADRPMVLTPEDGRVIFVIPQKDKTLVGTTEVPGKATFNQEPSEEEIDYLIQNLIDYFPGAPIGREKVLGKFAGVRPLVKENPEENLGKVARHHKIYQPHERTYVLLGGKYTTFRVMARDVVKPLLHKMGLAYREDLSLRPLKRKSHVSPWKDFELTRPLLENIIKDEFPKTYDDLLHRRLGVKNLPQSQKYETFINENSDLLPWS